MYILRHFTQFYIKTKIIQKENCRPFSWKKSIFTPKFPFKYIYHVFAFTLGQLSAYLSTVIKCFISQFLQVVRRPAPPSGLASVSSISPGNFSNFRPQTSKSGFGKGRDDICFACGKTGNWRVNCPSTKSYFTAR